MGTHPWGSACCQALWGSPTCNQRVAAEAKKLSCLVDCHQVKQARQVSPSWKGHVVGKGRHRTSQVSISWVFPEGLLGDTPKESHQGCWFHHLRMSLVSLPELPSPRTPCPPGPSLLELFPHSSAPPPTPNGDPPFCVLPKMWFKVGVSYPFLPKAISPTIDP